MRKSALLIIAFIFLVGTATAQTAKDILDKTAATLTCDGGIKAKYSISMGNGNNSIGTILVKGKMFHIDMPQMAVWFDGKTQWTYVKSNQEVNVTNPTDEELAAINPYSFLTIYKKGYKCSLSSTANNHDVRLTSANVKSNIQMIELKIDRKSFVPKRIVMYSGKSITTINISQLEKASLSDNMFKFSKKNYPDAEVIDLR